MSFSASGPRLTTVSRAGAINFLDAPPNYEVRTLRGRPRPVLSVDYGLELRNITCMALDPHGSRLAISGVDYTAPRSSSSAIKLIDAVSGRELRIIAGHTDWAKQCRLQPRWQTAGDRQLRQNDQTVGRVNWQGTPHTYRPQKSNNWSRVQPQRQKIGVLQLRQHDQTMGRDQRKRASRSNRPHRRGEQCDI